MRLRFHPHKIFIISAALVFSFELHADGHDRIIPISDDAELAIKIGLVLLGIGAAVFFLVFVRKFAKKSNLPVAKTYATIFSVIILFGAFAWWRDNNYRYPDVLPIDKQRRSSEQLLDSSIVFELYRSDSILYNRHPHLKLTFSHFGSQSMMVDDDVRLSHFFLKYPVQNLHYFIVESKIGKTALNFNFVKYFEAIANCKTKPSTCPSGLLLLFENKITLEQDLTRVREYLESDNDFKALYNSIADLGWTNMVTVNDLKEENWGSYYKQLGVPDSLFQQSFKEIENSVEDPDCLVRRSGGMFWVVTTNAGNVTVKWYFSEFIMNFFI